jgi:phage recombination protein Bet
VTDTAPPIQGGLVVRTAARFGVDADKLLVTLKSTAFKGEKPVSNEQMMALLIVSEQHRLNPFTKEIYAYPDRHGGIVPVVGIDGWLRIINEHPQFDGMETHWDNAEASMTCTIWRKDRTHPTVVTEYLAECRRNTDPWKMVHRMMRHKATMQCGRYAFGFAGLHDDEEAQDILRGATPPRMPAAERPASNTERFQAMRNEGDVIDVVETVSEPEPPVPPPTLEHFTAELAKAEDAFVGEMVMEEARELLSDEEMGTLAATYTARFTTGEQA